jgi:hypothetical protein
VSELFHFREPPAETNPPTPATSSLTAASTTFAANHASQLQPHPSLAADQPWRHFRNDTRAGRLLRQLYDVQDRKQTIKYPRLRSRRGNAETNEPKPQWFNGAARQDQVDPRIDRRRRAKEQTVRVPRVNGQSDTRQDGEVSVFGMTTKPIRRRKSDIDQQIREIEADREAYKPTPRRAIATDAEKRRLSACFQFKGGKALPQSGLPAPMPGHVPLRLVTGKPDVAFAKRERIRQRQREHDRRNKSSASDIAKVELEKAFSKEADRVDKLRKQVEKVLSTPAGNNRAVVSLRAELAESVALMEDYDAQIQEQGL